MPAVRSLREHLLVLLCGVLLAGMPECARAETAPDDPAQSAIRVYQQQLSAMRHLHCRFTPSCSQYAADAIARYGLVEGSARAADRLMRCNRSADTHYPRNDDGLLVDPVGETPRSPTTARVPAWLLLEPGAAGPPRAAALSPARAVRVEEAIEFARVLVKRGDCERASAEFQRAGTLADTVAADAWAYALIGHCYFDAAQWYFADRAYLTSAMLAGDAGERARVGYAAAVSRFDSEAFGACARLLADSALSMPGPGLGPAGARLASTQDASGLTPAERVRSLHGLCAMALGEWDTARVDFRSAAELTPSSERRDRLTRLAEAASQGPALPHRSPALAGVLSTLLPGAGQAYSGHPLDGVRHLLFNAALIYTVATIARNDEVPAAVIVGSVALPFYMGNVIGAREAALQFNRERRMRLLVQGIESSSR